MNDKKFSMCYKIIGRLEDMQTTEYYFKSPIVAESYDGNKYTITGIKYDCDMEGTDLDGALLVQVKTDWLYDAAIDIDGFNTDVVKSILEALPVKFIIRVSAHFGFNGQEKDFTIHEEEVDADCIIEDWAEENFPKLDWITDDQDQVVCYSSEGGENYLLATIIPRFEE